MRKTRGLPLLVIAAMLCAPCLAQRGHRNPPDIFQDESKMPAATRSGPDKNAMLQQASELKQLSDTVPDDIQKLSQGVLAKDLSDRLKRIEKLAKQLRQQVQQ